MNRNQASFSVKSSHKYANPNAAVESPRSAAPNASYYYNAAGIKQQTSYNPDQDKKQGVPKGMCIHTTETSVEDYY